MCIEEEEERTMVVERHTNINPGIMVQRAIRCNLISPLVVNQRTLMLHHYFSYIEHLDIIPLPRQHLRVLQQNLSPLHMVCISMICLRHVKVLWWQARSPHVSPIQHVWDRLKRHPWPRASLPSSWGPVTAAASWFATGDNTTAVWLQSAPNHCLYKVWVRHGTNSVPVLSTLFSIWSDLVIMIIQHLYFNLICTTTTFFVSEWIYCTVPLQLFPQGMT